MINYILYLLLFSTGYYLSKYKSIDQNSMKFLIGFFRWKIIISILRMSQGIMFSYTNIIDNTIMSTALYQLGIGTFMFGLEVIAYFNLYKFVKNCKDKDKTSKLIDPIKNSY